MKNIFASQSRLSLRRVLGGGLLLLNLLLSVKGHAAPGDPNTPWGGVLPEAIVLTVNSNIGQSWMLKNLKLESIPVPGQEFEVDVDLDRPETLLIKNQVNSILTVLGPSLKISNPHYKIKLGETKVKLEVNPDSTRVKWSTYVPQNSQEPNRTAIQLDMNLILTRVGAVVSQVVVQDTANPSMGTWTMKGIGITNRSRSGAPFNLRISMKIYIDAKGDLHVEPLSYKNNIQQISLAMRADSITVSNANPKLEMLNKVPIDALLLMAQDPVLKAVKDNVKVALETQVPALVNEKLKGISQEAKYVTRDLPPQAPSGLKGNELLEIKLVPSRIRVSGGGDLKISLSSQMRDFLKPVYLQEFRKFHPYQGNLNGKDDLLIELNPDYMNQLLHQSFYRKYFPPMGGYGFEVSFTQAPAFYVAPTGDFRVMAHMYLNSPATMFNAQLLANFVPRANGKGFAMVANGAVKGSFSDEVNSHNPVGATTEWVANKAFYFIDGYLQDKPYMLQDGIPLPDAIGPLNIDYTRVEFQGYDRTGDFDKETGSIQIFGTLR